jgi:hypothetical protein
MKNKKNEDLIKLREYNFLNWLLTSLNKLLTFSF